MADTWNFQTKFQYRDEFDLHPRRRPVFEILSGKDLFVATNFHRLTVVKFDESRAIKVTESVEIAPRVLKNKPIVFRESSYEVRDTVVIFLRKIYEITLKTSEILAKLRPLKYKSIPANRRSHIQLSQCSVIGEESRVWG